MRAINVYAWQAELTTQGRTAICSDASRAARRLGGSGGSLLALAEWHLALSYTSLADLAQQLSQTVLPDYIRGDQRTLQRGEVQTLAIDCHGSDGLFYPNGLARGRGVGARQLRRFGEELNAIGLMTASSEHEALVPGPMLPRRQTVGASTIYIMSCNTAAGRTGSELLRQLSYRWPGRQVVSFATTVAFPNLNTTQDPASGQDCVAPFHLDSGEHGLGRPEALDWWAEHQRQIRGAADVPWANTGSANAKIARDGRIIQWPEGESRGASLNLSPLGPPRGNTARPTLSTNANRSFRV